jgi:hypothetical protein
VEMTKGKLSYQLCRLLHNNDERTLQILSLIGWSVQS